MSKFKKIIICIIALVLIIPLGVYGYVQYKLKDVTTGDTSYISKIEEVDGITNILLLGTDGRPEESAFRTDSMIILTIDNNNKDIKVCPIIVNPEKDVPVENQSLPTSYFNQGKNIHAINNTVITFLTVTNFSFINLSSFNLVFHHVYYAYILKNTSATICHSKIFF